MKHRMVGIVLLASFVFLTAFTVVPAYAGTIYGSATITRGYNPTGESNKWWFFDETWTGTVSRGYVEEWTGYSGTLDLASASISVHFVSKVQKDTYNGGHEGEITITKDTTTISGAIKGRLEAGNYTEGRWVVDQNTKGSYKGWKTCTFTGPGETWTLQFFPDGFDDYGYNYGANLFVGLANNYDRDFDDDGFGDWELMMKWSDNWCPQGNPGANPAQWDGAWLTNHWEGTYTDAEGTWHFTEFVKIVYTGPGSPLWGYFTVIEDIYNDPHAGFHGVYTLEQPAGFGAY